MVTRIAFTALVALVAAERLVEVGVSRKHERALRARGAREHAPGQMPFMIALHASWLVAMLAEVWLTPRASVLSVAAPALVAFALAQALRFWAMGTLGERWTVRIITLPGAPPVAAGPFRYVRHPNYLGVALEIAALPLVHSAYVTAITFSVLNGLLMVARIRAEEHALSDASDYRAALGERGRFVPRWFRG